MSAMPIEFRRIGWALTPARVAEAAWLAVFGLGPVLFNPWSQETFDQPKAWLLLGCAALLLLVAVSQETDFRHGLHGLPLLLPALAVVGTWAVSTALSTHPFISWKGNYVRAEMGGMLLFLAYPVLAYALARWLTPEATERLCVVVTLGACLAAVYAICQAGGLDFMQWQTSYFRVFAPDRPGSTFGNPTLTSFYLLMALPFAVRCLLRHPLWCVAPALLWAGILVDGARGALLGVFVEAMAALVLLRQSKAVYALLIPGAFLLVGLGLHDGRQAQIGNRLVVWRLVTPLALERPLIGLGPETFSAPLAHEQPSVESTAWERTDNRLIDAVLDRGVLGVAADLLLLGSALWLAWKRRTAVCVMAAVALVGAWTTAMVDAQPSMAFALEWACYGLIASEARRWPVS